MNPKPIETANDDDLRLSPHAMRRAAQRARELALRTGTTIVVSRREVIERIGRPAATASTEDQDLQERIAPCEDKP